MRVSPKSDNLQIWMLVELLYIKVILGRVDKNSQGFRGGYCKLK